MELLKYANQLNDRTGEPQGYQLIRNLGLKAIEKLGWPTKKLEGWRYSPVQRLSADFIPQLKNQTAEKIDVAEILNTWSDPSLSAIISVNGQLIYQAKELNERVDILTLKEALQKGLIDSQSFNNLDNCLEALNVIFFENGFYLKVRDQVILEKPIHWIQVFSSTDTNPLYSSRLYLRLGKASSGNFIETQIIESNKLRSWCNLSTDVYLEEKSHAHFIQWKELRNESQETSQLRCTLESEAFLHCLHGSLATGWCRSDINVRFLGSNANARIHGLGLSRDKGIVDQQTQLVFEGPNNQAEQVCKNLLLDDSKAVFNGKIRIEPLAQKTDSSQLHQSLLLSDSAEVDTKPELEIFADDVKATHGATVGQLNADELFYFQSRGLSKAKAYSILCLAFLFDLVERIDNSPAQSFLKTRLENYWREVKK